MTKPNEGAADAPDRKLRALAVRNLRCIGDKWVNIELDDIVVLVGANNTGKSTILRAYELAMFEGSTAGKLKLSDFPNERVPQDEDSLPQIEVQTYVSPGCGIDEKWFCLDEDNGRRYIRERWTYDSPGKAPTRQGWDPTIRNYVDEKPAGWANVANQKRPRPVHLDAFADPEDETAKLVHLLVDVLLERVMATEQAEDDAEEQTNEESAFDELKRVLGHIQHRVADESREVVETMEAELTSRVAPLFPGVRVQFDPDCEGEPDPKKVFFSGNPTLRMGDADGHMTPVSHQGSGARRALTWAALKIAAERPAGERKTKAKKEGQDERRPHVLLMDEPEICLHPNAIREACRVLYDLASENSGWQVMLTTHSPAFIDLSRDNTTVVRVERDAAGVRGTTVFRPERAKLSEDDREQLKLLNACDPYVSEFFFGGRTVLVEGDTEYSAFRRIMSGSPDEFGDLHVVRARGKATLVALMKILNQFAAEYAVLHDSDKPRIEGRRGGAERGNPAWTLNKRILDEAKNAPEPHRVRLVASVPNFELALFGEETQYDKPYAAVSRMSSDNETYVRIRGLLRALVDHKQELPEGMIAWSDIKELQDALPQN